MSTQVQLKNIATGVITTHFSVDARDILPGGEYVQVGGPAVAFSPQHDAEDGPPVIVAHEGAAHLKAKGRGKFIVIDANGVTVTTKPLKKADAEAFLATLK